LYTAYCNAPRGDTAAVLGDGAFYRIYGHSLEYDTAAALAEFVLSDCACLLISSSSVAQC